MRKGHTFKIPNPLILDGALTFTARRLGAVLYSRRNAQGECSKSIVELAELSGCAGPTIHKALAQLEAGGYISKSRHSRYDVARGRMVYTKSTYQCNLSMAGGFTLIPRSIFLSKLKGSSFLLYLYLCYQAGNGSRAYPSLSSISRDLDMARATVCRGIYELGTAGLIYAQTCIKANRAFSNNSYFFLRQTTGAAAQCAAPHSFRPGIRSGAMGQLGILLEGRCRLNKATPTFSPYMHFRPPQQHWKPPFSWGSSKTEQPLLRLR